MTWDGAYNHETGCLIQDPPDAFAFWKLPYAP
jgi:hypothetical protein